MKSCKNCQSSFEITPAEKKLRLQIESTFESGPVSESALCRDCRLQRQMAWRNENSLYMRPSSLSGRQIISVYPNNTPFPVYSRSEWWGDSWDGADYGRDFDFSRSFFDQFADLQAVVPRPSMNNRNTENCDYSNFSFDSLHCYLSPCSYRSENLLYSYWMLECKSNVDCSYCLQAEQCFDCVDCNHIYNCRSCQLSHHCDDSYFLYDCRSCRSCFGCVGLRHKEYYLFNEPLTKDEYEKRLNEIDLQNPDHIKAIQAKIFNLKQKHHYRYSIQDKTENCTGDYIFESKNCQNCFQVYRSEDCINVQDSETKITLDSYHVGWSESIYQSYSAVNQQSTAFSSQCWDGSDNFYCDNCVATSHCFGCIGLKHKSYRILNKQYSKEEYKVLLPKIVDYMKSTGEWGDFFPISVSPFAYNETLAQEFYSLKKEEAIKNGYRWADSDPRDYQKQNYMVPDRIEAVPDDILGQTLACECCQKNYRVIEQELNFYRHKKIAIPKTCAHCRYLERSKARNPRQLFNRHCTNCSADIQTTYTPARPERIYCENCYLKTVY